VAWIVRPDVDDFGSFVANEAAPDLPSVRPLTDCPVLYHEDVLPLADIAHSFWGFGIVVVSSRALPLFDQPGAVRLGEVDGRSVIQIVLQLDLLDRELSVPSGFGPDSFEAFHLIKESDAIAGRSLFRLPDPNSVPLFCGTSWKQSYDEAGLCGLTFEPAVVG
jgi:hypothetical protein